MRSDELPLEGNFQSILCLRIVRAGGYVEGGKWLFGAVVESA
jgi:hypothetical protein